MLVLDNQQATISWFTGMLEGEGHFERVRKSYRVSISNTNSCLIEACKSFLDRSCILYGTSVKKKKTRGGKVIQTIYISGVDCYNLYKVVESKLECRRDQYQQLIGASETERSASIDFDWFIGVWQAEGCFSLCEAGQNLIKPVVNLPNTNFKIIEKVVLNLKAIDCPHYVQKSHTAKRPYGRVCVQGILRCQRFLNKTMAFWIGKRDQMRSKLLLEYIQSRLSKPLKESYSERELEIYYTLSQLNN